MHAFANTLDNAGRLGKKLRLNRDHQAVRVAARRFGTRSYLQRTGTSKAMLSVREERTVVGGVELARKTLIAATDEGLVPLFFSLRKDQ